MSKMPGGSKVPTKDMYWFAHGGIETNPDKCLTQRSTAPGECDDESNDLSSPNFKSLPDRKVLSDDLKPPKDCVLNSATDVGSNALASTVEKDDRLRLSDKRIAVEERKKQLWEAEQERNDAVMKKHMERDAALEARRNAQRSNISFAFGSSVPRNVETLQGGDSDKASRQYSTGGLQHKGDDLMSRSMTAALPAPRGRRKNDLMPTVPYDRTAASKTSTAASSRKRSVSMTRLDQLAQPRRHYVEATKASSTASSGTSSMLKDNFRSPTRPLSSASEQSGGSGRVSGYVNRRVRSSPRKPRPISIAGTVPDHKSPSNAKVSPIKRSYTPSKKTPVNEEKKFAFTVKSPSPKAAEKIKSTEKGKLTPRTTPTPKATKQPVVPKAQTVKQQPTMKTSSPKVSAVKKSSTNKKKSDILVATTAAPAITENQSSDVKASTSPPSTPPPDNANTEAEKNAKRIISEEEAKAALAEKRRLAREQAEKEAELERQRQEELRREEEERLRKEEEEHKRMEEEQLRLLDEHRRQEEEKLKKAIEEQERKEEEERVKREEELRIKAEQEKKAHEEADKQRIELEEKLRKEEEERAERKKRLEKIMSRTRGKTSGSSPSGSVSSDQLDSGENPQDGFSSGANSLDSNEAVDVASEPTSIEGKTEALSVDNSLEANPTYEIASENESLNSNDMMMPSSEIASQDDSMVIIPDESSLPALTTDIQLKNDSFIEGDQSENIILENNSYEVDAVPSENKNEIPAFKESSIQFNESNVHAIENVKDNILSAEGLDNQSEASNLENLTAYVESMYQPHTEEDQDFENIPKHLEFREMSVGEIPYVEGNVLRADSNVDHFNDKPVSDTEVVLSFNGDSCDQISNFVSSEVLDVINTNTSEQEGAIGEASKNMVVEDLTSNSQLILEEACSEEAEVIGSSSRNSISSDMKLPDPIYETSDEGSVSSEKHNQDFNACMLQEDRNIYSNNQDNVPMSDDVFSEQESFCKNSELFYQNSNPFSTKETEEKNNNAQDTDILYEKQFQFGGQAETMMESIHECDGSVTSAVAFEMSHSDLNLVEVNENPFIADNDGNKENIKNYDFDNFSSTVVNTFANNENQKASEFDIYADKENMQFTSTNLGNADLSVNEMHKLYSDQSRFEQDVENPFLQQSNFPNSYETDMLQQREKNACSMQGNELATSDQISDLKHQSVIGEPCEYSSCEVNDVTIIKAEGSENCIGIISSVDHDQVSNDFPKQNLLNEHLKSNFEYSSMTDSEDSSLDSNLSQVMTVENSEKETIGGLCNIQNLSESVKSASNTIEQTGHPFSTEHTYNGGSISKSNGTYICASEIISNGHRMESSDQISDQITEFHEYVQLGGNDISSVDHSKTNIFENVDAIDFSKVSPDPFLAKGSSNQISGNPFLLQDDQKQVLVTPDFFN